MSQPLTDDELCEMRRRAAGIPSDDLFWNEVVDVIYALKLARSMPRLLDEVERLRRELADIQRANNLYTE